MRKITLARETKETKIALTLNPDGNRKSLGGDRYPVLRPHAYRDGKARAIRSLLHGHRRSWGRLPPHDRGCGHCPWRRRETGDGRRPGDTEVRARDHPNGRIPRTGSTRLRRTGVPWSIRTFGSRTLGNIPPDLFEHFFYTLCIHAGITAHIRFTGGMITTSARQPSRRSGLRLEKHWK